MKKNGILNSEISKVLSTMGHTDAICIADCGLPIPNNVKRIDISLKKGVPSFLEVLQEIVNDMQIEKIVLAEEIKDNNKNMLNGVKQIFDKVETDFISHEEFKKQLVNVKAVIRTGEVTPYANVILKSGVIF